MKKLVVATFALSATLAFAGPEPVSPSALTIDFGASVLAGAGRIIKVMNVPVVNSNTTTYYNADLEFQFLVDGRLAAVVSNANVAAGPAVSPSSSTSNFIPGIYKEVSQGCLYTLTASGIGDGGARAYSMAINVNSCFISGQGLSKTYSFSTAPAATSPFINSSNTTSISSFPKIDGSYGLSGDNLNFRAVALGSSLVLSPYSYYGTPSGGTTTLIRQ